MVIYKDLVNTLNTVAHTDLSAAVGLYPQTALVSLIRTAELTTLDRLKAEIRVQGCFCPYVEITEDSPLLVLSAYSYVCVENGCLCMYSAYGTYKSHNTLDELCEAGLIKFDLTDIAKTDKAFYGITHYHPEIIDSFINTVCGSYNYYTIRRGVEYKTGSKNDLNRYTLTARNGMLLGEIVCTGETVTVYTCRNNKITGISLTREISSREIRRLMAVFCCYLSGIILDFNDIYVYDTTLSLWPGMTRYITTYGNFVFK